MQFVKNGPEIPERLLQEHQEGRVVMFCGAGISFPAGLPGFKDLVDKIYKDLGTPLTDIEQKAFDKGQYDATIDLLEHRYPGQRFAVRSALARTLKPKLRKTSAIQTHAALLQLARAPDGATRLVTTNFDRIFDRLIKRAKLAVQAFPAPLLPIPKNSRWNGIVYLHGILPESLDENALNRLVLSSGDFGLAYLTERWAARFVGELFRNYIVCFVGYSINDPVLRYMMDALAADKMLGETTPQAYAFADVLPGTESDKRIEWKAKGVVPILYETPTPSDHSALHDTLKVWGDTYRDGVRGRERIVVDYATTLPAGSTKQDNFVGRLLWAISDSSGLPAKRFAEFDPVPSLKWLEAFEHQRYRHSDLGRFGVAAHKVEDAKLAFSLLDRPAHYMSAPWMTLLGARPALSQWDDVMFQIAYWLLRHLNDPLLVWRVVKSGGPIAPGFAAMVRRSIDEIEALERDGKLEDLKSRREAAPNSVPCKLMRTIWRLIIAGRAHQPRQSSDLFDWKRRLGLEGLTNSLRFEFRRMLEPRVVFRQPIRWGLEESQEAQDAPVLPERIKDVVDWEVTLSEDHVHQSLSDLKQSQHWYSALPQLLDDVSALLVGALELMQELEGAEPLSDRSHWDMPSISDHWQNREFKDWTVLIELVRDAWLGLLAIDHTRAAIVVERWLSIPFPTFKRLALFAATQGDVANDGRWVDWLLVDDAWWLWSNETLRETMRVLVLRGPSLPRTRVEQLEAAILAGPPRRMYIDDLEPERWMRIVDRHCWLRLRKLASAGAQLGATASARLREIERQNPDLVLEPHEREEFSHWMSGTGDPDYRENHRVERAPRRYKELLSWLRRPNAGNQFIEDDWRDLCREKPRTVAYALLILAREEVVPVGRWRTALQVWSEETLVLRSWRYLRTLLPELAEGDFNELSRAIAWWLNAADKFVIEDDACFIKMCGKIIENAGEETERPDKPVSAAINHPVGHATQALVQRWFNRSPEDKQGLPGDIEPLFRLISDVTIGQYCHGRVILAANLIALFRVDERWTTLHVLPLFDWDRSLVEAAAAWEGFLWSPRLYPPVLLALKRSFLATAARYEQLGDHGKQYATFLTFAALDVANTFTHEELRVATAALPPAGLNMAAEALVRALDGAADRRVDYWRNRVKPYFVGIWPKDRGRISPGIGEKFARLCVSAGEAIEDAVATLGAWIVAPTHPDYVTHRLDESGLCEKFPVAALHLLSLIISDQARWLSGAYIACLDKIEAASPTLATDAQMVRLREHARRTT